MPPVDLTKCEAHQFSDTMKCDRCELVWDTNDTNPPMCKKFNSVPKIVSPVGINTCVHGTHDTLPCEKCSSHLTQNQMTVPGYESLGRILQGAYDQSAKGKGKERHANDKSFDRQPIMEIARMVGVGGHSYQMCKKAQEATGMVDRDKLDAAIAEFRGVIVYAASAILLVGGMKE